MTFEELKQKAASLPLEPGVYLMRDSAGKVIYVGKAKKLRNRVGQYFLDTASHSPKTRIMVSKIHTFEVIIATSEFEALVLECAQIKRYMPKYNILLKDDKGYPYIRLDMTQQYPRLQMVSQPTNDGACYYGPYGSRGITQNVINTIQTLFRLPSCEKKFPRDIGKGRVCLHYHMDQCAGWCQMDLSHQDYIQRIQQVRQVLSGNSRQVSDSLRKQMMDASQSLNFELAAALRDRIRAVEALEKKQWVTATGSVSDMDVIGYGHTETKACFAVLHFSGGELIDKDYELLSNDDEKQAVSSLLKQYYLTRGFAPKQVLLPFVVEDAGLFSDLLLERYGKRTAFKVPQRGELARLVQLSCKNALEEAERITDKEERGRAVLKQFAEMLGLDSVKRIESYDISNISGTDNVASMVVFSQGRCNKSEYKRFRVDSDGHQDDYGSMRQVLQRRFQDFIMQEKGFEEKPDLLLIDGGMTHAQAALQVLESLELHIPVFGMVKDNRHRTRALVTPQGQEIRIDHQPAIFSFVGNIQEETHRFAISYHRKLRSKRLKYSELDNIEGIGKVRKEMLLKHFSSLDAIRNASIEELAHYLPKNAAYAVYNHFHAEQQEDGV